MRAICETPSTHFGNGSFWSERVDYSYRADGTLAVENYRDSSTSGGATRRVKKYAFDAHRRKTVEGAGGTTGLGDAAIYFGANSYDGADNLTGVGLPFNAPPAWCGGVSDVINGTPVSSTCAALQYDGANRLTQMTEFPASGTSQRTVFSYDGNGNVIGVKAGCSGTDSYATCSKPASTYAYDDFGNVISATIAGASSGSTLFEVDAAGNQLKKRTASMATGAWLASAYDATNRLTSLNSVTSSGSTLLYNLVYDDGGGTAPSGCGVDLSAAASLTLGRLRYRQDSFGDTWLRYDAAGRTIDEVRARDGTCSGTAHNNPSSHYTYNANGDLTSIVYPYGRTIGYVYGTGALAGRVASVTATFSDGTSWQSPTTIISNVTWEPFGGLRSYQAATTSGALVEYLPGDNGASPGCPAARPGSNDATGRLRGLWVSTIGGSNPGDIMKLTYTWQADQITETDTCLLGTTTPRTENFAYDATLRLSGASRPSGNFTATGGAFKSRTYGYDGRGNRTSYTPDGITLTPSYDGTRVDQLTAIANTATGKLWGYSYSYDADGRVTQKLGPIDSTGGHASTTSYVSGPDASGANDTVFKSVTVQGAAYNYFYDTLNRRRYKAFPVSGIADEYFYDLGHQLLVDQGYSSLSPGSAVRVLDEYVWLGGRPVAIVRGNLTSTWTHQADSTGSCARYSDAANCGTYFAVTDVIGKAVLMLNSAGHIVGTGEYDPFGHVNRVFIAAETVHPYGSNTGVIADFTQAVGSGFAVQIRGYLDLLDLNRLVSGASGCGATYSDTLAILDGSTGGTLTSLTGVHQGLTTTAWVAPSTGRIQLSLTSAGPSCSSNNLGCCQWNLTHQVCIGGFHCCATSCSGATSQKQGTGVVLASYEYRRYEAGQVPFWTPLRFPGQYYDAESELSENWNRYYMAPDGRYNSIDPYTLNPEPQRNLAVEGTGSPAYSYATNDPLADSDPTGLFKTDKCPYYLPAVSLCKMQASKITEPCLKTCVMQQCECNQGATIHCGPEAQQKCADYAKEKGIDPSEVEGVANMRPDQCNNPTNDIWWCSPTTIDEKCILKFLIHELAHVCGWQHGQPKGVPGIEGFSCN